MVTKSNQLQRYMSRGTCLALFAVLAIFLFAAATNASAQAAQPIVVSQTIWDGAFPNGSGSLAGDTPAGSSWAVNSDSVIVAAAPSNGNNVLYFTGAGYPATVAGPFTNVGAVAIDSNNFLYVAGQYTPLIIKIPMGTNGIYTWTLDPGVASQLSQIPACTGVVKTDEAAGECLISTLKTDFGQYGMGINALAIDSKNNLYFAVNDQGGLYGSTSVPYAVYECTLGTKASNECIYGSAAPALLWQETVNSSPSATSPQYYIGGLAVDPSGNLFFTDSLLAPPSDVGYAIESWGSNLKELQTDTAANSGFNGATTGFAATPLTLESITIATPAKYDDEIATVYIDPSSGAVYFGAVDSGIYALTNNKGTVNTSSLYAIGNAGTKLVTKDAYGNLFFVGYNSTNKADTLGYISLNGPTFPGTATTATILVADNTEPCTPTLTLTFSGPGEFAATPTGTCSTSSIPIGTSGAASFDSYTITLTPQTGVAPAAGLTVTDTTSNESSSTLLAKGGIISGVDQSTWGQPFLGGGVWGSVTSAGTSGAINSKGTVILGDSYGNEVQQLTGGITGTPTEVGAFNSVGGVAVDSQNYLYMDASYSQLFVKVPMASNGTYSFTQNPAKSTTGIPTCTGDGTTVDSAGICILPLSTQSSVTFGGAGSMVFDAKGDLFFATNDNGTSNVETIYECNAACLYAATPNPVALFAEPPANSSTGNELLVGALALDSNNNVFFTDTMVSGTGSEYNLYSDLYELPVSASSSTGYAATPTLLETLTPACTSAPCNYNNEINSLFVDAKSNIFFADQYTGIYELANSSGSYDIGTPMAIAAPGAKIIVPDGKGNFYFAGYNNSNGSDTFGYDLIGSAALTGYATAAAPTTASIYVLDGFGCNLSPTLSFSFTDETEFSGTTGSAPTTSDLTFGGGCSIAGTITFTPGASTSGTVTTTMTATDTQNGGSGTATITATAATAQPITFTSPSGTESIPYSTTPITLAATGGASGNPVTFAVASGPGTLSGDSLTITGVGPIVIDASQAGGTVGGVTYAPGTATITITVTQAPQTITFTAPSTAAYGTTVTLSATGGASGEPVVFSLDSTSAAGAATLTGSSLKITGIGKIVVDANQTGNTDYAAAAQVQVSITAVQATQAITFAPTSPVVYTTTPITLTATGGGSGNSIVFTVASGPGTISGSSLTITGLGTIVINANQAGNTDYSAAPQVQGSIVVTAIGTVATPAISPASGNTLSIGSSTNTVTITDSTANAVIVYTTDGSNPLTSTTAQTYSKPFTLATAQSYTVNAAATLAGYTASTEATASYTVVSGSETFTMSASTTTATVTSSTPATVTLSFAPTNGLNTAISFSCTPSSTITVSCSFSPSSLTPTGNDAALSTTLTISKGSGTAALQKGLNPLLPGGVTFAALAFCFLGWKKRRGLLLALLLIVGAVAIGQLTGCGGSSSQTGTLTVNATSGSVTQSTTINVTVN